MIVVLGGVGIRDKKEADLLARWYSKLYIGRGVPGPEDLIPIATELGVAVPASEKGRSVINARRDKLRDSLMLDSCL